MSIATDSAAAMTAGSGMGGIDKSNHSLSETDASDPLTWRVRRQLPDRQLSRGPCRARRDGQPLQGRPAPPPRMRRAKPTEEIRVELEHQRVAACENCRRPRIAR
jgi:hypothetical protein